MHVRPKGELLAFGIFGGIAFVGFLMSFGIRDQSLEAKGWDEEEGGSDGDGDGDGDDEDEDEDEDDEENNNSAGR